LKNVFEPMLLESAAVRTRMPAQASIIVLPLMTLFVTGPQPLLPTTKTTSTCCSAWQSSTLAYAARKFQWSGGIGAALRKKRKFS